jgi:hypothetical protein
MKEFSESVLEEMLDYYANFAGDSRILSMIEAADRYAKGPGAFRVLEDDDLDIAAAGDAALLPEKPEDL